MVRPFPIVQPHTLRASILSPGLTEVLSRVHTGVYCRPLATTIHRVPEKKQATLIIAITSPSVEIFLQFLKHFVQE